MDFKSNFVAELIGRELIQELNRTKYYSLVHFTCVCLLILEDNGK
jgi:hypothetical protein